jgi:hypothetical protein
MKSQKIKKILLLILGAVAGYTLSKVGKMIWPGEPLLLTGAQKALILGMIIPCFLIVIAWHELGHAYMGVRAGFDFRMFVVGPFMWEKGDTQWRFRWNKNLNLAGGLVLCVPRSKEGLAPKVVRYAAGGPLASLLLAVLLAIICYACAQLSAVPTVGLVNVMLLLTIMASFSALIFIVTSIPMHSGGFYSDGARVLRLLRGGDAAKFDVFFFSLMADISSGKRPRLLDVEALTAIQDVARRAKEPFAAYLPGILYQAYLDRGNTEAAAVHLDEYIGQAPQMPAAMQDMVWLDAAFFHAYARKDLDTAQQYWAKFRHSAFVPKGQVLATEAVMAQLGDDPARSAELRAAALRELPNMLDQGLAAALRERLG